MPGSPRDENRIAGLIAKSDADNTPVVIEADPTTKRLKVNATITGGETGLATSAKQDTLLTELQLKANLTEEQPVYDEGNNNALTRILEQVTQPLWYDPTTNRLYVRATIDSGTVTTVSTVTTVGTVTGLTNVGGVNANSIVQDTSGESWGICVRNLLT